MEVGAIGVERRPDFGRQRLGPPLSFGNLAYQWCQHLAPRGPRAGHFPTATTKRQALLVAQPPLLETESDFMKLGVQTGEHERAPGAVTPGSHARIVGAGTGSGPLRQLVRGQEFMKVAANVEHAQGTLDLSKVSAIGASRSTSARETIGSGLTG
jgi:hypothetical protein